MIIIIIGWLSGGSNFALMACCLLNYRGRGVHYARIEMEMARERMVMEILTFFSNSFLFWKSSRKEMEIF